MKTILPQSLESTAQKPSTKEVFGPTTSAKRVALYARVSTHNGHQDPELQLRELRAFVQARGWTVASEYVDRGVSGSKDRRPELDLLMAGARSRAFDILLVWKLDRFARSLKHLVTAIAEFEALGLQFVSLRDNLDLTTPSGRLMFHVIGAMAEFERALIQERVRAGLRNARAKGKRLGRPTVSIPTAKVQRLRAQGLSWSRIAAATGVAKATLLRHA
jgi:DNA invertase Pin-like site-specific DNA recombinase